ncbi:CLUMA_CG009121, isoform A [Clunio marinus]|uniref:CLUMA_CG009121, isoform A n=1 Tax=Clunio marinus TaxID=568069 RepID=A0A1J1I5R0_9DIPT|nr:CLUMA_CG009121, isoform A [Clunio marinus]
MYRGFSVFKEQFRNTSKSVNLELNVKKQLNYLSMGCASSSPLVNGGAPAGIVDSAKTAATEVISSGENALNELGENITETAGQVKETMEEAVNGMANSIGGVIHDGITKIPLKETMNSANHLMEENMENLKNEMMNKAQSIGDETDKIADELIKDTEDVIRDAETGILDIKNNAVETVQTVKNDIVDGINLKSPTHSVDFNQASVPEPEIEKLLKEEDIPTSPKATVDELVNLRMNIEEEKEEEFPPTTQEEFNVATNVEEPSREATPVKIEDELVVEDIKDENLKNKLNDAKTSLITTFNAINENKQKCTKSI